MASVDVVRSTADFRCRSDIDIDTNGYGIYTWHLSERDRVAL